MLAVQGFKMIKTLPLDGFDIQLILLVNLDIGRFRRNAAFLSREKTFEDFFLMNSVDLKIS